MISGGYWGRIARVNLSTQKVVIEGVNERFAKEYIGGAGFASRILLNEVSAKINPFSPENRLIFSIGPFQGTPILGSGRWTICTRSPLTGVWGDSTGGGDTGWELKRAGFDGVIIQGRVSKPVYLWIHDGEIEIEDAAGLWGRDAFETVDCIKEKVGKKTKVATIGQAGENLVRFACIVNDKHGFNGRYGMGAVMGSKNLKAVAIRGTMNVPIANPDKLKKICSKVSSKIMEADFTKTNREYGMPASIVPREKNGLLPIKNWKDDTWQEGAKKLGTPRYNEELKVKPWPCRNCVMGCHRRITSEHLPEKIKVGPGPEYETLAMLGSNLLIDDLDIIVRANDMCNRYGMDTIELGGILGLVFEAYEKNLIGKTELDGVEAKWGNGEALLEFTRKIATREGYGSIMAEGIKPVVEEIGPEARKYAIEVKGGSVAAHDPRAFFSMAVETATATRGACHIRGFPEAAELGVLLPEAGITKSVDRFEVENKGFIAAKYQDLMQVFNSLVVCFFYQFSGVTLTDLVNLLNAVTGWDITSSEMLKVGERITNLQHMFNLRMGANSLDDKLPERLLTPHKEGGAKNKVPPLDMMLKEYYKVRGWYNFLRH